MRKEIFNVLTSNLFIILLLLLVSIPAVKSLFIPGAFTSHDLTHHIIRQIDMDRLLSEGQFPPRWSGELNNGYGYPLFLFNYPMPALLGEIFHKMGLGFVDSTKAVFLLSLLLSVIGMYLFLKSLLGSFLSAFLGAVFYLYAPIHLIVVYVSGAPGAALGLVFPPFIFWAILKLWQGKGKQFLFIGSLSLAGLILSHNITAFIFMPVILSFIVVLKLLKNRTGNSHFLLSCALMFLVGLGLSAWFWLPALAEKQFIRYDQLMKGIYHNQFPSLRQIIYSPWGYGLSHPKSPEIGGISYQVGLAHLFVMGLLLLQIFRLRRVKSFLFLGIFSLASFAISIFFMMEISEPLWDRLPFLSYIQFPVRILIVPVFSASLAAALLIKYWGGKILFIPLFLLVLYANRNHLNINQSFNPGEQYYLGLKTTTTSFDENLPIWVSKMETKLSPAKFSILSGEGNIKVLESQSARVVVRIEATTSAKIRFNQYYFPGWEIKVDDKKVNFNYSDLESNGMPVFDIEKGSHLIKAEFKNTPVRNLADTISVITVIMVIIVILNSCRPLIRR